MPLMTYKGSSISAILERVREEHGDDVVIVSTCAASDQVAEVKIQVEPQIKPTGFEDNRQKSPHKQHLSNSLESQGLAPELVQEISARASSSNLVSALSSSFSFQCKLPWQQKAVALVGPTGVGKTTTIAKLAAQIKHHFGSKVGLISIDHFRVGAGFQLQTYAALLELPCRLLNPDKDPVSELRQALIAFAECDTILIDTVGCGWRDAQRISHFSEIFSHFDQVERMLVLPAPGNDRDLLSAADAFRSMNYQRSIVTKIDESGYIGPVLNTLSRINTPLAFFTTGQRVPEDIEPASSKRLAWMLERTVH